MSIGTPPLKSQLPAGKEMAVWTQPWAAWFTSLWQAIFGWNKTYTGTLTHDFGSIATLSQATQTVTITGARSGDAVIVRPTTAVNGIIIDGTVTADDTVTVRAVNYSSGSIDPASQIYRIICFQQ
ncbi:MAG: hypothetical protein NUV80_06390 [Candidatus Berkelbacteria bacterium]|nr:hypothetical protein [Candidatus Berkelbacteria bacterium]